MDKPTNISGKKTTNPALSPNGTQSTVNQTSSAPRASNISNQYGQSLTQPIVNRSCTQKDFSKENTKPAIYSLSKLQFSSSKEPKIIEFGALREIREFREFISKQSSPGILNTIQELNFKKLKNVCGITIDSINKLLITISEHQTFFTDLTNLVFGDIKDILNSKPLKLPNSLNSLTTLIIGKIYLGLTLELSDTLINLSIEDIEPRTGLRLRGSLSKLQTLSIGNICQNSVLDLPGIFPGLTTCTIGNIAHGVTLKMPDVLNELETLTIGNINCKFMLPLATPKLKTLSLGDIGPDVTIILCGYYGNLEDLVIGNIRAGATCKLLALKPCIVLLQEHLKSLADDENIALKTALSIHNSTNKLKLENNFTTNLTPPINLKSLTIGTIDKDAHFELSDAFTCLTNIIIGDVNCSLSFSLPHLSSFTLGNIGPNTSITLGPCNTLASLVIGDISDYATFQLQEKGRYIKDCRAEIGTHANVMEFTAEEKTSFVNFKNLTIGTINQRAYCQLPNLLNNLETIIIGNINCPCILSIALPKLRSFTLGNISSNVIVTLSNCLNLRNLIVEDLSSFAALKLLQSQSRLTNLTIGVIHDQAIFELPDSLNSLRTLSIQDVSSSASVKLPSSLNSFTFKEHAALFFLKFKLIVVPIINAVLRLASRIEELTVKILMLMFIISLLGVIYNIIMEICSNGHCINKINNYLQKSKTLKPVG